MTNGEKYRTANERQKAFEIFCRSKDECVGCPLKDNEGFECSKFRWLELKAEEEKPMNCPFCGNLIVVEEYDRFRMYHATCNNYTCRYQAPMRNSKDEAIAAHNRVCKAVAAYKENN